MTTSAWIITSSILSAIGAYGIGFYAGYTTCRQQRTSMGASLDSACDEMESVLAHHGSDLSPMVRHSLRVAIEDAERTLLACGVRQKGGTP